MTNPASKDLRCSLYASHCTSSGKPIAQCNCAHRRPGRPPTAVAIMKIVIRMAVENPTVSRYLTGWSLGGGSVEPSRRITGPTGVEVLVGGGGGGLGVGVGCGGVG